MDSSRKVFMATFQVVVFTLSFFSFSYFVNLQDEYFEGDYYGQEESGIGSTILDIILGKIKEPMVPTVSASSHTTDSFGSGCCKNAVDGSVCAVATADTCEPGSDFAEGALCTETSFCVKGCCYSEGIGAFYPNVLESSCEYDWVADPACNLPAADLGCCFLGTTSKFSTQGECKVDTEARALSNSEIVDWDPGLNEIECAIQGSFPKEGACVIFDSSCSVVTAEDCFDSGGQFNEGYLCTSEFLDTACEPTRETTCVPGKDGVYFKDSCGNYANIYDADRFDDDSYWSLIISPDGACNPDSSNGNGGSLSCGNCNRFEGGICSSSNNDGIFPEIGENYCRPTECIVEGETYESGEAWCDYDGKIGDGDDVVGSLHWINICNQGVVDTTNCGDYRNGICVQQNTFEFGTEEVAFRGAGCATNNADACLQFNQNEDKAEGIEECEESLNCEVHKVEIGEFFKFDVCTPKYPKGFNLKNEKSQLAAQQICSIASQKCEVIKIVDFGGQCGIVANEECLQPVFEEGMNELCRSVGDCGLEANIAGATTENLKYKVDGAKNTARFTQEYLRMLRGLSNDVPGQFAEVEDYSEYLSAVGIFGAPGTVDRNDAEINQDAALGVGLGIAGVGYAAAVGSIIASGGSLASAVTLGTGVLGAGTAGTGTAATTTLTAGAAGVAAFAAPAIGFAVGLIIGMLIGQALGLPGIGVVLMSVGAALVGAAVGVYVAIQIGFFATSAAIPIFGWIAAAIGAILIGLSFLFGEDCENINVEFECKPWVPPRGGDDCSVCNEDPNRPCTQYACNSLGAACDLVNKGTSEEACVALEDDGFAPQISFTDGTNTPETLVSFTSSGIEITDEAGGCLPANEPVGFGLTTNEEATCKYSLEENEFANMETFGSGFFVDQHFLSLVLPDPSHGRSQGVEFSEEMRFYIKCEDVHGNVGPIGSEFFTVDICIDEGTDITAPRIMTVNPPNDGIVGFEDETAEVEVFTNELASCRWSSTDERYETMPNSMECNDLLFRPSSPAGYVCETSLPLESSDSTYYFRCEDQPFVTDVELRNANGESFEYKIRKSLTPLVINYVKPDREFVTATDFTSIEIEIGTSGGGELHRCSYSFSGFDTMIGLFETGTARVHKQQLNLGTGVRTTYVECLDVLSGDTAQASQEFTITRDVTNPQVARVWQDGEVLTVVTNEEAECVYSTDSCRYTFEDGKSIGEFRTHTIDVTRGTNYYIKCQDDFGNYPSGCSINVRAV